MNKSREEQLYSKFKKQGYNHQEARELSFKSKEIEDKRILVK